MYRMFLWRLPEPHGFELLRRVPGRQACVSDRVEDLLSVHCGHVFPGGGQYVHGVQRWTVLGRRGVGMRQLSEGQEECRGGEFLRGVS